MDWHDAFAWVLQLLGATGAIWGLFSKDTSRMDPATHRTRLTARGWLALVGVTLGVMAFGASQWREVQQSRIAEAKRLISEKRAADAERTLQQVNSSQGVIQAEQNQQLELMSAQTSAQAQQIAFLSQLALAQQQWAAVELWWPASHEMQDRIARALRALPQEGGTPKDDDVYLPTCLSHGEIALTRRPNYSWRLDCKVARPQGMRSVSFEIAADDPRVRLIDTYLDALLSSRFALVTAAGDELFSFSTGVRPVRVAYGVNGYTLYHDELRTRLSALQNAVGEFQMQFPKAEGLPARIRVRSRDPLVTLDTTWQMSWQLKETGKVMTQVMAGEDPVEETQYAATSARHALNASFDRMLRPPALSERH
jgi:hypothetical protein